VVVRVEVAPNGPLDVAHVLSLIDRAAVVEPGPYIVSILGAKVPMESIGNGIAQGVPVIAGLTLDVRRRDARR
jgi:hypothetical protein